MKKVLKLTINQSLDIKENEIIVNCSTIDSRLQHLLQYIRQYSFSLTGVENNEIYQVPIEKILFIDSTDGKSFLYSTKKVYEIKETLSSLEQMLVSTPFVRISKNCILNTTYLKSVRPIVNHRMEATLKNGEKLIISRNYIENLKEKIKK